MKPKTYYEKLERFFIVSTFLVLALLLSTNNGSVVIAGLSVLISILALFKIKDKIKWDNTDKLVLLCLSAYTFSNIPLFLLDWGNFRYFRGASRILLCIPIYIVLKHIIDTKKIYNQSLSLGVFSGSLGAFSIALYQHFIEGRVRVDGFLFSINFGYLACSLAVLSLALLHNKSLRILLTASFVLSTIATLLTLTRGAIFALVLVVIFMAIINIKKIGLKGSLASCCFVLAFAVLSYTVSPSIKQRVNYTVYEITNIANGHIEQATSSGGRLLLWRAAFEAFKERPLFGLTHPEREALNKKLADEGVINEWAAGIKRGHAHSQYFDQLASGGILGLFSILFTIVVPFGYFFKYREKSDAAYVGCLFVFSFALFCLTEVALQQNLISTFYGYMLALFFAVTQLEIRDKIANVEST
ncbi:O-antigen ligase family protein [Vibrio coralliilyticus]|uniref:O-antigen ligase family protein n=1 Tax=Vibrio coralliilyticus TaxID=190893 RepID=UPI00068C5FAD|nr:O-antigen ligase family protein [Vibrio coralliilyticus]